MPTVLITNGYRYFFYSNEGNEPPHVHVAGRGIEAKIWLIPVHLAGLTKLSPRERRVILKIANDNIELLLEKWNDWHKTNY